MTIIKFDSEKADALIRDLTTISSNLDSNFTKIHNNSRNREISLSDSRLQVWANKTETIDVLI